MNVCSVYTCTVYILTMNEQNTSYEKHSIQKQVYINIPMIALQI